MQLLRQAGGGRVSHVTVKRIDNIQSTRLEIRDAICRANGPSGKCETRQTKTMGNAKKFIGELVLLEFNRLQSNSSCLEGFVTPPLGGDGGGLVGVFVRRG